MRAFLAIACGLGAVIVAGCSDHSLEKSGERNHADIAALIPNAPWPTNVRVPAIKAQSVREQISEEELGRLEKQALAGDAASANIVMRYHGEFGGANPLLATKWRKFAAENGDVMAMGLEANALTSAGGEENCLRAKSWYERALLIQQSEGSSTEALLANLVGLAENWQRCLSGPVSLVPVAESRG